MSGGKNDQGDMSLSAIILGMILIFGLVWAGTAYAEIVLIPWKALRLFELAITFQWGSLMKLWHADIVTYDQRFDYVNDRVWFAARFLAIPMAYFTFKALKSVNLGWNMEDHLQVLNQRFRWLSLVVEMPKGIQLMKKFPFFKISLAPNYLDADFPEGIEPLDFFATSL